MDFSNLSALAQQWLAVLAVIAGSLLIGLVLKWILFRSIRWYNKKRDSLLAESISKHLNRPAGYFIPILLALLLLPLSNDLVAIETARLNKNQLILKILLIISGAWMLIQSIDIFSDFFRTHYNIDKDDNLEERKIITQFAFVKRLVSVIVFILAISLILYQFENVRKLGMGLLTSAGVAGIIIGLAAQKSIANLLAGFQIAFTQPIRLDDVVIVEGEWGRIEEITLTYVVVRIWDQRRLVVPLQYFNEKSFQNWTRTTSELLGTVFIYTDYTMPVETLREELSRLLETNPKWDKRVGIIQVTDTTETTMQIRALMSARNAGDTFDLRCHVREGLITFIQQQFPEALPKTRVEMQSKEQHQNGEPKEVKTSSKSGKKESEVRGN
jgi:small-conductance mechanosensitive channel